MKSVSIMSKLTARDIRKNFFQYVAMICINMLAVTLFCGFISNAATLDKTLQTYYADSHLADIVLQYSAITENDREFLDGLDSCAEYRLYAEGSVNRSSAKLYVCQPDNQISLPLLTEGKRGVLIDKHEARRSGLGVGSQIEVSMPLGRVVFTVSGIMTFSEAANAHSYSPVYIDSDMFLATVFPLLPEPIRALQFRALCNQVVFQTDDVQRIKDAVVDHYLNEPEHGFVFASDRASMESVMMLDNEISQSLKMIYVFPVIFLLVAALVVLSTVGPLILRERTNIGMLKSVGFSNKRILLHYSLFGAVLCFIGGVAGAIAGPLIVPNVLLVKYNLVYSIPPYQGIVFRPLWSILAVAVVCVLAALIGMAVCGQTVREKPAACMRPLPPKEKFLRISTSKNQEQKPMPRGIPLKIAMRNIAVKPLRALMTVAGITGCVALLACSFGVGDTVNHSIDYELGGQFRYDIAGSVAIESQNDFIAVADTLLESGAIERYEIYKMFYFSAKFESVKDIRLYVLPADAELTTIRPEGKTLISRSVAEDLGVHVGESVSLSAAGNSYLVTIDGIIETAFTKGVFVSETDLFDDSFYALGVWVKSSDADTETMRALNDASGTDGMKTMRDFRAEVSTAISSIDAIQLTMMVFAVLLAVVVLYNLSLLSIKERSRDIATMKVLGFSTGQIGRMLLYEILVLTMFGTLFGLVLGYPVTVLVMSINRIEVLTFLYQVRPISYLISALISIVTALLIHFLFLFPIQKIHMIESLKSVE